MGRYKRKGIRGNWVEDDMKLAISAVKRGVMKVYTAAKRFNVPRRTLRRYLAENINTKSTLGRKPLLSSDQENYLKSRIIRLCNVGYPLTQRVLRSCVKTFYNENNILAKSQGVMIGRDWLRGFLKRHPNISRRKAQKFNPARAQKLNKTVVSDYFAKLKDVMEKYDLMKKPERIFNIDEKGCQLNLHKTPHVLAERGTKRVHIVAAEHGESVTVVSCGNALGHAIPPMILFKGKRMKGEWLDSLPTGAVAQMTPKGSMTTETFVNWIHHFSKFKLPGNVLLIFDGAKCHLDYSIVEVAEKYEIKLFCLPSNTTHELQPMDKSVFRSFEYYWDEEVLRYWSQHEDRKITKQRFGVIFGTVWDKAATPANIKAGFECTGIYPFNPDRIPEEAYAPSIPTYNPMPLADNKDTDTDASDVSESILHEAASNVTVINTPPPVQRLALTDNTSNTSAFIEQIASNVHDNSLPIDPTALNGSIHNDSPAIQDHALLAQQPLIDNSVAMENESSDNCSYDDVPISLIRQQKIGNCATTSSQNIIVANEPKKSFCDMLKTPEKFAYPVEIAPRKKAINSLAQELTKSIFPDNKNIPGPSNSLPKRSQKRKQLTQKNKKKQVDKQHKNSTKSRTESWYCFVCEEDRVADMRPCFICATYVHEECVGLTAEDKEQFICTKCSND